MDALLRMSVQQYANAGSTSHAAGREAAASVAAGIESIAHIIGAASDELVMTSGATESNNLAILGTCLHPRQKRRKVVSVLTEHRAVLDPLQRLREQGFEIIYLPIYQVGHLQCGQIDLEQASSLIDDKTALVTVMLANNEIGVLQSLDELATLCRKFEVLLHSDATQAVGHIDIDVDRLGVDLMSFSAHKFYGPKGIGGLFVRHRERSVRIYPQIVGGGQQENLRSGTLNSSGIVAMSKALERCASLAAVERPRIESLRNLLWSRILDLHQDDIALNGPALEGSWRLGRNLNCRWSSVEGQSLMLACPELCVSSGSACTSANPSPSHVLQAIGLSVEQARCSIRFGLGRFNTQAEIETAASMLFQAYDKLRRLG